MTAPQIDSRPRLPNGWFAVAWSKDLVRGDVKRIRYFDTEMVLFRTRSGKPAVLDAYCSHLGAHLAEGGRVVGETIRCPFHAWQYDGTGACVEIPYCERIPPKARVNSWNVDERNEMIFVWYHAEGKPADWTVPTLTEFGDPAWTEPRTFELEVPVHMQDMAENNCDPVHFQYVHGMDTLPPGELTYGENKRFFQMKNTHERETPLGTFEMTLIRDTWGLGLSAVRSVGIPEAGLLMFSSTTAVDGHNSHSRWVFTVTKNLADIAGEEFVDSLTSGVQDDMRIWSNKIHRAEPVFCEADTYLVEFRHWCKQFYSDST